MGNKLFTAIWLPAIWLVALSLSSASAEEISFDNVPVELRDRYQAQKADIEALINSIKDDGLPGKDRAEKLAKLQLQFPYMGLPVASSVALSESEPLQLTATRILIDSVVMMNHPTDADHDMHKQFATSMSILAQIVERGSPGARILAAEAGASLGDREILGKIRSQNSKGVFSDADTVGYFTLADPELAAPYVDQYLTSTSVAAQKQAIAYLGPLADYQNTIRRDYLFDPSKPAELQAAAARVLARTDADFDTYSDKVIKRDDTPVEVIDAIIRGSIENKNNPVDAAQISKYETILQDYSKANPDVDAQEMKAIQKQIQTLE
ncbi:MAG: hypothetical protein HYU58_15065 [Proteobacteria bacterium]|nr:hypothetical protein [Pseudomonadota bacterium]